MNNNYEQAVYGVLNKYEILHTEDGVKSNLDKWEQNKSELLNLLRKHPNWNEKALAVLFKITERRGIDKNLIEDYTKSIYDLSYSFEMTCQELEHLYKALSAAAKNYDKVLINEECVQRIKNYADISCTLGQKTSRVINKICKKFGLDKHPDYNAKFAILADSLNPLEVKRTALLSVHPCDYLEMSNPNNSWKSCHRLDGGEYCAGTLSYMNDGVSMIFCTVDDDVTSNYYKAPKRTRQVFCYGDGILLQSRLYPNTHDDKTRDTYRNLVQQAIATCLNVPNLWTLKKEQRELYKYYETTWGALHYADYDHSQYSANISLLKSIYNDDRNDVIHIGHIAYCVNCSDELDGTGSINCSCYNKYTTCADCGTRTHEDDVRYINGYWYCSECSCYCNYCNNYVREIHDVYNRRGDSIFVCEDCRDNDFHYCEECGEYYHHSTTNHIDGNFYCDDCAERIQSQDNENEEDERECA